MKRGPEPPPKEETERGDHHEGNEHRAQEDENRNCDHRPHDLAHRYGEDEDEHEYEGPGQGEAPEEREQRRASGAKQREEVDVGPLRREAGLVGVHQAGEGLLQHGHHVAPERRPEPVGARRDRHGKAEGGKGNRVGIEGQHDPGEPKAHEEPDNIPRREMPAVGDLQPGPYDHDRREPAPQGHPVSEEGRRDRREDVAEDLVQHRDPGGEVLIRDIYRDIRVDLLQEHDQGPLPPASGRSMASR